MYHAEEKSFVAFQLQTKKYSEQMTAERRRIILSQRWTPILVVQFLKLYTSPAKQIQGLREQTLQEQN